MIEKISTRAKKLKSIWNGEGIFSMQSLYVGVVFGGPFVVGWLLAENYKTLGKKKYELPFKIVGGVVTVALVVTSLVLRHGFVTGFLIQIVALFSFVKYQERFIVPYLKNEGRERLVWPVICILVAVALCLVFYPVTFVRNENYAFALKTGHTHSAIATDTEGFEAYKNRKFPQAISAFTKSIAADPKDARAYLFRGQSESHGSNGSGNIAALSDMTSALTKKHNSLYDRAVYYFRGGVYASTRELEKSLADLTSALATKEDTARIDKVAAVSDEEIYLSRAAIYHLLKNDDAALADINAAVAIDPNFHGALLYRAILENIKGDLVSACKDATDGTIDKNYALNMKEVKAELIKDSCKKK